MEREELYEKAEKVSYYIKEINELKEQFKQLESQNYRVGIVCDGKIISSFVKISKDTLTAILKDIADKIDQYEVELKEIIK